jgi:hypothetical protein
MEVIPLGGWGDRGVIVTKHSIIILFKSDFTDNSSISTYNGKTSGKILRITPDLGK